MFKENYEMKMFTGKKLYLYFKMKTIIIYFGIPKNIYKLINILALFFVLMI